LVGEHTRKDITSTESVKRFKIPNLIQGSPILIRCPEREWKREKGSRGADRQKCLCDGRISTVDNRGGQSEIKRKAAYVEHWKT